MNGVACRHEMVAREGVVTDHVTSHRGGNTSHRGANVSTSVEILLTAVGIFSPRWECSHRGGNVSTSVEILLTAVGILPTAVRSKNKK